MRGGQAEVSRGQARQRHRTAKMRLKAAHLRRVLVLVESQVPFCVKKRAFLRENRSAAGALPIPPAANVLPTMCVR